MLQPRRAGDYVGQMGVPRAIDPHRMEMKVITICFHQGGASMQIMPLIRWGRGLPLLILPSVPDVEVCLTMPLLPADDPPHEFMRPYLGEPPPGNWVEVLG